MGIVTPGTLSRCNGRMEILAGHIIPHFSVTTEAQCLLGLCQQGLLRAGMRQMTGGAALLLRRFVGECCAGFVLIVTIQAESVERGVEEVGLPLCGLMRIVAAKAVALLVSGMDAAAVCLFLMTFKAEFLRRYF